MKNAELQRLSTLLQQARSPEEVFGSLAGTPTEMFDAARSIFRQLAKVVHPDLYQGTDDFSQAGVAFQKLGQWWELAQRKINHGIYGNPTATPPFTSFTIHTRKHQYKVERLLAHGDLCHLYLTTTFIADKQTGSILKLPASSILKLPVQPQDNDLITNEARILKHLQNGRDYEKRRHFISRLTDTFAYHESASGIVRQVNVLAYTDGLYSLQEIREVYPQGIDPKDMAWMWRRLLVALGFAHANKVIHGAVLPSHVLIHPQEHGLVLIDWSYAVLDPRVSCEYISAISRPYREWYPAEVFSKGEPTPGLDIAMAARCMIDLLGGNPLTRTMPDTVPWKLQSYFKGCTLAKPEQRPQDTAFLLKEFDSLIEKLWGPRTFRKFIMPGR